MSHKPESILVPTDFSTASDRAIEIAKGLADRFDAEIHALHVRQLTDDPNVEQSVLDEVEWVLQPAVHEAGESLKKLAENDRGLRYVGHVEHGISVADAILDAVGEYNCDLVIMGTHGRRPLSQFLMGSVARRVVRFSPVPVITTHAGAKGHFPPTKILAAYDSSEDSIEAVRFTRAWASAFGARVVLIHVVEDVVYPAFYPVDVVRGDYVENIEHGCRAALERAASEHLNGIESESVVVHDKAARGITAYARDHDCDLVVLATRGLSGVAHVLMGSVAARVVRTADVPVLTVRSEASDG